MMDFERELEKKEAERRVMDMIIDIMIEKGDESRTHVLRVMKAYWMVMTEARKIMNKLMQEEKEHEGVLTDAGKATAEQMIMIIENTLGALEGLDE